MPIDPRPLYGEMPAGSYVTQEGEIVTGPITISEDAAVFISHYATCPYANDHRRIREREKRNAKPGQIQPGTRGGRWKGNASGSY